METSKNGNESIVQTSAQDETREKGLRSQVQEGACAAVMQGSGETYLSAFALLLHSTPFQIGLLAAVPPIIGTLSQLLSVKVLDRVQSRKPLILIGAAGQALAWLPLLVLPMLFPGYGSWLLLAGVMLYFAMGHLTVPAWNSLITDMIDDDRRGMYFARRAKVVAVTSFAALSVAGLILHASETWTNPAWGFAIIFLLAGVARLMSTGYLTRLKEPPSKKVSGRDTGVRDFLQARRSVMFRRFLLFSGSFHVAAMMAGPFFVVYLLRDLHLTYLQYGAWLAAPILGQLLSLQEWGRIADTYGNKKVLALTGLIIPILPVLYIFSSDWVMLVGINFLSGLIWPGFSLSLGNYVFDAVQPGDRTKGVAIYNTVNAIGAGIGAMLGSWLATMAPSQLLLFGLVLPLASNLPILFLTSGILRLMVSLTLLNTFKERRRVTPITHRDLMSELPLIKPIAAVIGGKLVRR
jgi:MFS family permease